MQKLWDVAPPLTWGTLTVASVLLLGGFVLLSHTLLRRKAHGDVFSGLLHEGRLEWTLRLAVGCLLAGSGLWAWELEAPTGVVAALCVGSLAAFGVELVARLTADA